MPMKSVSHPDYVLIGAVAALLVLGILILSSISAFTSQEKFGNTYYFLKHQLFFGLLPGLFLAFLFFRVPLNWLKKGAPLLLLLNLIFCLLVFFPKIGATFLGGTRWLSLGPISFQPSEFLKITFIIYLAVWLASRIAKDREQKFGAVRTFSQTFIAFLIVIGAVGSILIFQPDISTLVIIVSVAALMYFLAGTPFWHTALLAFIGSGTVLSLIKIAPYRMRRWTVFLNPETDPLGMGFQIKQALIAVGSGGPGGLGLGMSSQKFGFLPHSMSDSIFAVFCEETGFVGAAILILLFLLFFWRGFKISKESRDRFSQQLSLGISIWITLQAFVNIGSMIGILPLAGIPLPFISYGGSALISEMVGVGILLNVSKNKMT